MARDVLKALGGMLGLLLFVYLTYTYGSDHDGWWFQEMFRGELTVANVDTLAASVSQQQDCELVDHGRARTYTLAERETLMTDLRALLLPIAGLPYARGGGTMDDANANVHSVFGESGRRQRVSISLVPEDERWRITHVDVSNAN